MAINFVLLQNCKDDFDGDFLSLWNNIGENVRSLTLYYITTQNILKILNSCHNLKVVDLQLQSFKGK